MKVLQSSYFRAIIAIVIGALLVQYREQMVQWLTISIGVLFFLSGIISCATYISGRRSTDPSLEIFDTNGNKIEPLKPNFPIVGLGSLILGIILALMPTTFINWLMYILAAILILGAINQFVNLASATKYAHVGAFYWIMPSLILLIGIIAILYPQATASAPMFVIGWCTKPLPKLKKTVRHSSNCPLRMIIRQKKRSANPQNKQENLFPKLLLRLK